MDNIAIFGAGGFGRELFCIISKINEQNPTWNIIGFFDDEKEINSSNEYGKILGGINELNTWPERLGIIIAIGNPDTLKLIYEKISNPNIYFPNIIHNLSVADNNNYSIGKGNIIISTYLSCNTHIDDFNIFNGNITIGHDVRIGSFNTFMPSVRISGEVAIGNQNFFGINSIILQQIKIGSHVRLGAGSILYRNPKEGMLYLGNPAQIFKY